jgi:hypothetical protein
VDPSRGVGCGSAIDPPPRNEPQRRDPCAELGWAYSGRHWLFGHTSAGSLPVDPLGLLLGAGHNALEAGETLVDFRAHRAAQKLAGRKRGMKNTAILVAAAALSIVLMARASATPAITNGSFEAVQIGAPFVSSNPADVPGWTHSGSPGDGLLWAIGYSDSGGSVTTAGAGNQFVTLGGGFFAPGTADWSTTITGLTSGDSYILSFMTATELGTGTEPGGPQTMTVGFISGSSTSPQSFTSADSPAAYWRLWVTQHYAFVANASSAVVDFSVNNQQFDMGLDNVRVTTAARVPEPSSMLLLSSALVSLIPLMRRHRKHRGLRLR